MESADVEMLALFAGLAFMIVVGAVASWIRSRADRRLSAALNAYAERQIAANRQGTSSREIGNEPRSERRRGYAFSET